MDGKFLKTAGTLILLGLHPSCILTDQEFQEEEEIYPPINESEEQDPERWDGLG